MPSTFAGHLTEPPRATGTGRPIPNALVTLYLPGTSTSPTFYSDRLKTTTVSASTIVTDANGNLDKWVEPGIYEYWYNGTKLQSYTVEEDNGEDDVALAAALANLTTTLNSGYYTKAETDTLIAAVQAAGLLGGSTLPLNDLGQPGSFYIYASGVDRRLYGPKTTAWPSSYTDLKGAKGEKGDPGVSSAPFLGAWNNGTSYVAGVTVSRLALDGNTYIFLSNVPTTGQDPNTNPTVWANATQRGPAGASGALPLSQQLAMWVAGDAVQLTNRSYDPTYADVISTSPAFWPDNSTGTYSMVSIDTAWSTVKSFSVSHALSGSVVTQPPITRDASGRATVVPTLQVAGPGGDSYLSEYTGGYY